MISFSELVVDAMESMLDSLQRDAQGQAKVLFVEFAEDGVGGAFCSRMRANSE